MNKVITQNLFSKYFTTKTRKQARAKSMLDFAGVFNKKRGSELLVSAKKARNAW
jgi:hypothetical protein